MRTLDTGAVYEATAQGVCNFGEVLTTDGRNKALGLTVLDDHRAFLPNDNLAPVVRTATLEQPPELADLFAQIGPRLTDQVMRTLSARVDVTASSRATSRWTGWCPRA